MFSISDISVNDTMLKLKVNSSKDIEMCDIAFRVIDEKRFVIYTYISSYEETLVKCEGGFEFSIDLKDFIYKFDKLNRNNVNKIMLYIKYKDKYKKLKIEDNLCNKLEEIKCVKLDDKTRFKVAFKSKDNSLELIYYLDKITGKLIDVSVDNNEILFSICTKNEKTNKDINIDKLKICKRVNKDILKYTDEIALKRVNDNLFKVSIEDIYKFDYKDGSRYDLIGSVRAINFEQDIYISIDKNKKLNEIFYKEGSNYNFEIYKTKKNRVAFKVNNKTSYISVDTLEIVKNKMKIKLKPDEIIFSKDSKLYIEMYNYFKSTELDEDNIILKQEIDKNSEIEIDIWELFGDIQSNYIQSYKIMIKVESNNEFDLYELKFDNEIKSNYKKNAKFELKNSIVKFKLDKSLQFNVNPVQKKPIKIGVLGSCFSRAAFRSRESYYNPNYKMHVEVPYTHFWFSVIGALSKPLPEKYNESNFKDIPKNKLNELKREYYKTTFDELQKEDVDYVMIDFFNDAVHGLRRFSDGSLIVRNVDMGRTNYYKNVILNETEKFDYSDENFWLTWKNSCDELIKQLSYIVPQNKIILNISANLTEDYYDKNGVKRNFVEDKTFRREDIKYYNMIWQKMNRYFLTKSKNIKIIDMSQYEYLADVNHPVSIGPHHFESEYYKKFFDEVIKVVMYDKQINN